MAANTVVDLTTVQDLLAETKAWGYAEWTVLGLGTAAASVATLAAATDSTGVKVQHYLDHLTLSVSGAVTTNATVFVKDGSTVIWECQWGIGGPLVMDFNFEKRPLPGTAGNSLSAGTSGTLGAALVVEVTITGHSNRPFAAA